MSNEEVVLGPLAADVGLGWGGGGGLRNVSFPFIFIFAVPYLPYWSYVEGGRGGGHQGETYKKVHLFSFFQDRDFSEGVNWRDER